MDDFEGVSLEVLLELLEKEALERRSDRGEFSAKFYTLTRLLGQKNSLNMLAIINCLLEEEQGTGIIRNYTKGELLKRLPWKKS